MFHDWCDGWLKKRKANKTNYFIAPKMSLQLCPVNWNTRQFTPTELNINSLRSACSFLLCSTFSNWVLDIRHTYIVCEMSWNCKHVCTCESFLSSPLQWPDELFWLTHSFPRGLCSWVYLCWQLWWETPAHHYRLVAKLVVLGKSKGCSMFQASFSNGISVKERQKFDYYKI